MPLRFTVLASGSGGNASLVEAEGFGLLIDVGLGPRQLASRLAAVGASWCHVHAVLLTHTHSDHWRETTLAYLRRLRIPLYCHADHQRTLPAYSGIFAQLRTQDLVHTYEAHQEFSPAPGLRCRALPLRHDGGATFAFRLEGAPDLYGQPCSLGYVADLGSWTGELAQSLADVDLLALEFNHDVMLEYSSGRSQRLISRVLGDDGHLSNVQAAALLQEVLRLSAPGRLRQVVQLHLSRDCNRPELAAEAARAILDGQEELIEVHTASQDIPAPTLAVGVPSNGQRLKHGRSPRTAKAKQGAFAPVVQPWLPGLE